MKAAALTVPTADFSGSIDAGLEFAFHFGQSHMKQTQSVRLGFTAAVIWGILLQLVSSTSVVSSYVELLIK